MPWFRLGGACSEYLDEPEILLCQLYGGLHMFSDISGILWAIWYRKW